jgi:hypothetical protein
MAGMVYNKKNIPALFLPFAGLEAVSLLSLYEVYRIKPLESAGVQAAALIHKGRWS